MSKPSRHFLARSRPMAPNPRGPPPRRGGAAGGEGGAGPRPRMGKAAPPLRGESAPGAADPDAPGGRPADLVGPPRPAGAREVLPAHEPAPFVEDPVAGR